MRRCVLAIAAHPDDIEYMMAGTLLLLRDAGWEAHYFNLSSGNCGSKTTSPQETARIRLAEARAAAARLGAVFHPPIADDLEIVYSVEMVRKVAAVVRAAGPGIVLTHSPQDYMEDHTETCRLAVSAAFAHSMPNFAAKPPKPPHPEQGDVAVYHAMPHSLRDAMRQPVHPDIFVDTTSVQDRKLHALEAHHSQQNWLAASQGMNSYLQAMTDMAQELGRRSAKFRFAEGWRRHSHVGFSQHDIDPLSESLPQFCLNAPAPPEKH
jgi:LmbE family N-acetylglucosaminyl deacetylase